MKLQFVDADNLLPGALMSLAIAHRLISLYNPYNGVDLSASSTLEGVARLSSDLYSLIYRNAYGTFIIEEGNNAEISSLIGNVWGGAFIVLP